MTQFISDCCGGIAEAVGLLRRALAFAGKYFLTAALCIPAASALAGGGPENVLLVVNPNSRTSLTIANHYVRLREIPPANILHLPWPIKSETGDVETFRQRILGPVLQTIANRRLSKQIDYVVYSSDFPWGIALDSDLRKIKLPATAGNDRQPEWPKQLAPVGSLTGMTYFFQSVMAGQPAYFDLQGNYYMRLPESDNSVPLSIGFRAGRRYDNRGAVVAAGGRQYLLSTMLGVTAGRGNTLSEVLDYLQRSAAADGTQPKGTIYFVRNNNVRSKARHDLFPTAVEELTRLGVAAEVIEGTVPLGKDDVQGVVMGTSDFDWKASGSTILPGAICEHFTSFGGVMKRGSEQTPLSEFLRYGAAGSCGTVAEPFAIPQKFPSPMIQVHYARGCTLAEAFYQSVHGPYQLLIVGDALCRPWADVPNVSVEGVGPGDVVHGTLAIKPTAKTSDNRPVQGFGLFVDGLLQAECRPGETFRLDTVDLPDGYHEIRVVAIGPPPIESQGRLIIPVRSDNHGRKIEAALVADQTLRADKPIAVNVSSPSSIGIVLLHGSRLVGRLAGTAGRIEIPPDTLGAGPVRLRAIGLGEGGPKTNVVANPLEFEISWN